MMLRSDGEETLLVVIMSPLWLLQINLAIVLDLTFFKTQLIFQSILVEFSGSIGTMTCLYNRHLVVMLILGLIFFCSLITLCISSIFLDERFQKFFLILIMLLMLGTKLLGLIYLNLLKLSILSYLKYK